MMQFLTKKINNRKGFTLIELIVVIAILGILIAIAVPRLGGFRETAADRANESNAKLLTNIAQVIQADTGEFPDWPAEFSTLSVDDGTVADRQYITEPVVFEADGTGTQWSYEETTGIVTAP